MNELLQAAKAVIDAEFVSQQRVAIENLRAAVERAERQEAVGFDEWYQRTMDDDAASLQAIDCWTAAQQAERERIKDLLRQSDDWFEDEQMEQAKWLLEKIDATNG